MAGDMNTAKSTYKNTVRAKDATIVAGRDISAGRDLIVGNQIVHNHVTNAGVSERETVRKLINYLDNRRVLTDPHEWEKPDDCVQSVFDIRVHLAHILDEQLSTELESDIKCIQTACRTFLTESQAIEKRRGRVGEMDMRRALDDFRDSTRAPIESIKLRYSATDLKDGAG